MRYLIFSFIICTFYFFSRMADYDFSFRYDLFYALFAFCFFIFIHQNEIIYDIKSRIRQKRYNKFYSYLYSSHFDFAENYMLQISHNIAPFYDSDFEYCINLIFITIPKDDLFSTLNNLQTFYKNLAKDKFLYYDLPDKLIFENYYKDYQWIFSFKNKDISIIILLKIYNPNDDLIKIGLRLC